jgi:copper(I)-binding protein
VTRLNRRLLIGAMALLLPALAGCEAGLNAPTLQFHEASNGTTIVQNNIRIDDAFVLASTPAGVVGGQAGTFLTIYATNGDRLVSVSAPGAASSVKLANGPVDLPANTLVDMSGPVPQVVLTGLTSPLTGGETIQMSFNFATAGTITVAVPVEAHTEYYATFSPPPTAASSKSKGHAAPFRSAPASPPATP